jgi:hypothetical protein
VSIDVSFDLGADADPTTNDLANLKFTIADESGIPEYTIKHFSVVSTANRRKLTTDATTTTTSFEASLPDTTTSTFSTSTFVYEESSSFVETRHLTSAYTWVVTFVVEASLSDVSYPSATALSSQITTTLTSSEFQTAISDDIPGTVVDTASVSTKPVSPTRQPTKMPVPFPTSLPTALPVPRGGGGGGGASEASTTFIIIGACAFSLLLCGGFGRNI